MSRQYVPRGGKAFGNREATKFAAMGPVTSEVAVCSRTSKTQRLVLPLRTRDPSP